MSNLELFEKPEAQEINMIAGWRQWADGGAISSGYPEYLIKQLGARKIGRIKPGGFYLFQTPLSQAMFRPEMKFEDGYRTEMSGPRNDVYYWGDAKKGLVIFIGDEPHLNIEQYSEAFFEIVSELGVKRVAATGGVYAMVPYEKDRRITCNFSLPSMRALMKEYAVELSDYKGPVSIGSYLNNHAEALNIEYFAWYGFVPMYDLSRFTQQQQQGISVEEDFKAWLGLTRRFNHLFGMTIALGDLAQKSEDLDKQIAASIEELVQQMPQLPIREYLARMTAEFEVVSFEAPDNLSDVWGDALGDLFKDGE